MYTFELYIVLPCLKCYLENYFIYIPNHIIFLCEKTVVMLAAVRAMQTLYPRLL